MKKGMEIVTIGNNEDHLLKVIEKIKKDSVSNILYLNCICGFKIDNKSINYNLFDSCFYSEDCNLLILFSKGAISSERIEEILSSNNVPFTVIRFSFNSEYYDYERKYSKLVFVNNEKKLINMLSSMQGRVTYYPDKEATLSLSYPNDEPNWEYKERNFEVVRINCRGIIEIGDRKFLIVDSIDNDLNEKKIESLLKKISINYTVNKEVKKK